MTGKHRQHDEERLAQLYREQGDIEPGPGVDQRIRARAREETRSGRLPRPARWLGGVAVAASLLIVVSVVTNIEPPEAELPVSELDRASGASETARAERAEASDFMPARERRVEERARTEAVMDEATPMLSAPLPEPSAELRLRDQASDDAERTARHPNESLGESRQAEQERPQLSESLQAADEVDRLKGAAGDAEEALWLIDRLVAVGNAPAARAELETFRRQYPQRSIPQSLLDRLEQLEDDGQPD